MKAPCAQIGEQAKQLRELLAIQWRWHLFDRTTEETTRCRIENRVREHETEEMVQCFDQAVKLLSRRDEEGFKAYLLGLPEEMRKQVLNREIYDYWHGNLAFAVIYARLPHLVEWCLEHGSNPEFQDYYHQTAREKRDELLGDMALLHPEGFQPKVLLAPVHSIWGYY